MRNAEPEVAPPVSNPEPRVIVLTQPAPGHDGGSLKTFEQVVNLIKAIAWPVLIAVFFLVYRDTARQVAEQVPVLLGRATKVSAGGLAIEIKEQAEQAGGSRLSSVVTSLDGTEVQQLLKVGCGYWGLFGTGYRPGVYSVPSGPERDLLAKLESRHLVQFLLHQQPITLKKVESEVQRFPAWSDGGNSSADPNIRFFTLPADATEREKEMLAADYKLTDLGRSAFNSVLAAVTAQLPGERTGQSVGCR